jgi:hypothetical protein
MMNQINKLMELVKALQEGTTTPQEIAAQVKQSLPPHLLAMAKNETAESLIGKLEPLAASFLGKEVADLLKTEATTKILTQALDIIKAEDPTPPA